jgi:hypothetical protein
MRRARDAGPGSCPDRSDKFKEAIANYRKAIDAFTKMSRPEPTARGNRTVLALTRSARWSMPSTRRLRPAGAETSKNDDVSGGYVAEAEALRK